MEARSHVEQNVKMWNEHDTEGWVGDFAPTAQISAPGASGTGPEMARAFYSIWQDAFPDARIDDERIFSDGDTGTLQAVFTGTHTATMNAPGQAIPATGRSVTLPFVVISRYEGGKVVEFGLYFDRAELMGQLGLLPDAG